MNKRNTEAPLPTDGYCGKALSVLYVASVCL